MRRFQSGSGTSSMKMSKHYEHVARPGVYSFGPTSPFPSKDKAIKLIAVIVAALIGISALHAVLAPRDLVYGLMIDAGSTGSRIHTYSFTRADGGQLDILHEDFHPIKPGLSHYKDDPDSAAQSLKPLLERAMARVPKSARRTTPVVLRATAGLRKIGEEASGAILSKVRQLLRESEFRFDGDEWATILAGNEEGVYSWITVNYLLDRSASDTVGTLEMGGGSAQVAYVPRDSNIRASSGNCSLSSESVEFKGAKLPMYTVSHLNFGLQAGREMALGRFEEAGKLSGNPCINNGEPVEVDVPFKPGKTLSMSGSGDYSRCRELIDESVMRPAMGTSCQCDVCTYHGAAQPRSISEYVAIAFYLERTVAIGLQTPLTVKDIREKGEEICGMSVREVREKFPAVPNGKATDLCFDLAFITLHLERGHGIHESSETTLMVLDKIKDFELGWCLGAMQQTMAKLALAH